jgi:hypothetical protein
MQDMWVFGWMFQSWDLFVGCYYGCMTPLLHGLNSLGGDHVYVCVFIFILHFEVYSQNVVLVFKLVAKLYILPYTK